MATNRNVSPTPAWPEEIDNAQDPEFQQPPEEIDNNRGSAFVDDEDWDVDPDPVVPTSSSNVHTEQLDGRKQQAPPEEEDFEDFDPEEFKLPPDFDLTQLHSSSESQSTKVDDKAYLDILFACQLGYKQVVSELLERLGDKVDINRPDFNKWPLLFHAILKGHSELVSYLIEEKGAKADLIEIEGLISSLMVAAQSKAPAPIILNIISILVQNGADPNARTFDGRSPLHFAVLSNRPEVIGALIKSGTSLDALTKDGIDIFEWATMFGHGSALRALFTHKMELDPTFRSFNGILLKRGVTLAEYAVMNEFLSLGRILYKLEKEDWRELYGEQLLDSLGECNSRDVDHEFHNDPFDMEKMQISQMLSSLDLRKYKDKFEGYSDLILASKEDLRERGIVEIGARSRITRTVRKMLNKSWSPSTISFEPEKVNASNAYNMLENSAKELILAKVILDFLSTKSKELLNSKINKGGIKRRKKDPEPFRDPQILSLRRNLAKIMDDYEMLDKELSLVLAELEKLSRRSEFQLADKIEINGGKGSRIRLALLGSAGAILVASFLKFYYI